MTLRQKVGQLLVVGFRGLDAGPRSPILRDIRAGIVGGVVLFDRDLARESDRRNIRSPRQVRTLVASLQEAAAVPLLVAVDQEGGAVARLKKEHGFPEIPAARRLGEADDPERTRRHAAATAAALAAAGFNLNLAPVVDLDVNPDNPIIGRLGRAYSSDPAAVVRHARAVIEAHREHEISCCLKHFPGHGSSRGDSHLGFTNVSDTWDPLELEPFSALIACGLADVVMSAHVFNRHLDPEFPATLSEATIGGLLRDRLGFRGVVVTDDLDMKAVSDTYLRERALELALNAGNDILLIANNMTYDPRVPSRAVDAILGLVASGRVARSRIDESWRRVLELKGKRTSA
ncbi:MAG: glycoside hydrolase family 3 protein [Candidatus Aminicenantes bacterium]|nr:glycoside hydrolase family 3 protein [Candidatus Aminicenantes bacterium]